MSESASAVTDRHVRYLAERTIQEDAFLQQLKSAAQAAGIPPIWIAPEQGAFFRILLSATGAREVVEVGALAGYAAVWMARGLPEAGRVRTIEIDPARAAFARAWTGKSDVAGRIEVIEGDAREVLGGIPDGSVDAIFLDADKKHYSDYLEEGIRMLRCGGLVLADNAFAFGELFAEEPKDPETAAIRAFNEWMAREARLESVILPYGDGCWMGVKR